MTNYNQIIDDLEKKYSLKPGALRRLVEVESNGWTNAESNKGAIGLTQLLPSTAEKLGVDPYDPIQNLEGGAKYLRQNLDKFDGSYSQAYAAYNAGPNNKAVQKADWKMLPTETKDYLNKLQDVILSPAQASEQSFSSSDFEETPSETPSSDQQFSSAQFMEEPTPPTPQQQEPVDTGFWSNVGVGAQRGQDVLSNLMIQGANALGLNNVAPDAPQFQKFLQMKHEERLRADEARKAAEQSTLAAIGQGVGSAALNPISYVAPGGGAIARGVGYGLQGATQGLLENQIQGQENTPTNLLTNVGAGLLGGATAEKLGSAARSVLYGKQPAQEATRTLIDLAKQQGVDLSPIDIRGAGNQGLKKVTQYAENIPLGGAPQLREAQNKQLSDAAQRILQNVSEVPQSPYVELATSEAIRENPTEIVHRGLQSSLMDYKDVVRYLYNDVSNLVEQKKSRGEIIEPVRLDNLRQSWDDMVQRYGSPFKTLPAERLAKSMNKIALARRGRSELDFTEARSLRSQLENYISRAYKSAGAVGDQQTNALQNIKSALERDIQNWAETSHPDIAAAEQQAREAYKNLIVPFKEGQLKQAIAPTFDPDVVINTFIKNDRPGLAQRLYEHLPTDAQAAVKTGVLQRMIETSTKMGNTGEPHFNPMRFAGEFDKLGSTKNVIFDGPERRQLEGLVKLSRMLPRATQYVENPATGNRLVQIALGGIIGASAVGGPSSLAATGLGIGATKALHSTSLGKLLQKLAMTKSTRTADALVSKILNVGSISLLTQPTTQ